jgi:hypothetical protein
VQDCQSLAACTCRVDLGGAEQSVRTIATVQSAEELAALEVTLADGRHIRLDQVAKVYDSIAEPRAAALAPDRIAVVNDKAGIEELDAGIGLTCPDGQARGQGHLGADRRCRHVAWMKDALSRFGR